MAWYTVKHICTHEARHQLFGKVSQREWRMSRMENDLCPDCWKEKRSKEIAEENARSAEQAKEAKLPELTGSEKQIAWATTIRQEFYEVYAKDKERLKEEAKKVFEWTFTEKTDSSYWIDMRSASKEIRSLYAGWFLPRYEKETAS